MPLSPRSVHPAPPIHPRRSAAASSTTPALPPPMPLQVQASAPISSPASCAAVAVSRRRRRQGPRRVAAACSRRPAKASARPSCLPRPSGRPSRPGRLAGRPRAARAAARGPQGALSERRPQPPSQFKRTMDCLGVLATAGVAWVRSFFVQPGAGHVSGGVRSLQRPPNDCRRLFVIP